MRRDESRGSRVILGATSSHSLTCYNFRQPKVNKFDVARHIQQDVLRFQIPVHNFH